MKNKKKIYIYSTLTLFFIFSASIFYTKFPAISCKISDFRSFSKANLQIKKIKVDGELVCYAEGGHGPTLIFLHGFQGDKRFWLNYIQPFISSYHIIIPDLPAHGGSSSSPFQRFDLKSLAITLDKFMQTKKLDKFRLIGSSLGAGLSLQYSVLFPDKVVKLVLLNPIGIRPDDEDEFKNIIETNKRMFFPTTVEQLDDLYIYLMGQSLPYSLRIKKYILDCLIEKRPIFQKVYLDLISGEGIEKELFRINIPTLVLMGKHDKVSRPIDFEIYSKYLPRCSAFQLDEGYHIFKGSAFDKALDKMKDFICK